jgi:hypothetical protein
MSAYAEDEEALAAAVTAAANAVPGPGAGDAGAGAGAAGGPEKHKKPLRPTRREPFSIESIQKKMEGVYTNVFARSSSDYKKNAEHFYKANAMVRAGTSLSVP